MDSRTKYYRQHCKIDSLVQDYTISSAKEKKKGTMYDEFDTSQLQKWRTFLEWNCIMVMNIKL